MLTAFQEKKLTYLFKFLDFNKNGILQHDDFSDIAGTICEKREFEFGTRQHKYVMDKCVKIYHRFLKDMTRKGAHDIHLEEWLNFFDEEIVNGEDELERDDYVEIIMDYVFGLTDKNKDGFISKKEYLDIFSTFRVGSKHAENAFDHLDANKDNKLSRYEVKHSIEMFITSESESDMANWVFGNWETEPTP